MTELILDQFWECPVCGGQAAMGLALMLPPKCGMGHPGAEMEQKTVEAWQGPGDES